MSCLILGGGGFIGSAITEKLLKEGMLVKVFERSITAPYRTFLEHEKLEWIKGDFSNRDDLLAAMDNCSSIIHLVSTTIPGSSNDDPIFDIQTNLVSSINILECMREKNIKKIIFSSSGGTVYGEPKYLPIDELHPTDPIVSYGITKLAIEKYILMYSKVYDLSPVILRIANPYGQNQALNKNQGLIGVFINQYLKDKKLNIWGDGCVVRDYIHVDDVAEAFIKSLTYKGDEKIFNIGSSLGLSINQIIDIFHEIFLERPHCTYSQPRSFDVSANILACELAKRELSWDCKKTLKGYLTEAFQL